ncbi:MAG: hypothetical protein R3Y60_06165 [bacterium]
MKKILTLALSICAILSLSACDGDGYSEEEKESNQYYQYIESTVEAHRYYGNTSSSKIATEDVNIALAGGDGLFNDFDYVALRFYRNIGTVLNSITFTISSEKDVMLWGVGFTGFQEYLQTNYSTKTTLIENLESEIALYADSPLTITLNLDECKPYSTNISPLDEFISYKTLPSGFSREQRAFILYFIPYEPGTSNVLGSTEKITPYDFGIRFSNIIFDFELEG